MQISYYRHHLVVIGLLGLTAIALVKGLSVTYEPTAGIRTELPEHVGAWTGEDLFYCTNATCAKSFRASALKEPGICPQCGQTLLTESPFEKPYLPGDTTILKKSYRNDAGDELFASIVLSGKDRSSIHRPQLCLTGQGFEIVRSRTIRIPLGEPGRGHFQVMVLDVELRGRGPNGKPYIYQGYFAYWFAGPGRETASHVRRMYWMAMDRLFHGKTYRWSYISVAGLRHPDRETHIDEVRAFIADLHPLLMPR